MTDGPRPPLSRRVMVRVMPVVFRIVNVPMRLTIRHDFCIVRWTSEDASARETIMG